MFYAFMRRLARIALRWYYRDVEVIGADRVPTDAPLLVVANHPNAMVDPMLVATTLSRRVTFTGKATLFENPFLRAFLGSVGMVPLRRASDERARRQAGGAPDPKRNEDAFRAVIDALAHRRAVLIFPEGKSHDEPSIAPLKTGTARMALQARAAGVRELVVLPIGFVFEDKSRPRTRILVEVGDPITLDTWPDADSAEAVDRLTSEIDRRLRAVTTNYETAAAAAEVAQLSTLLAGESFRPLGMGTRWAELVAVGRRRWPPRAEALRSRMRDLEQAAAREHLDLVDATIDTSIGSGAKFVVREGAIAALAAPFALLGRIVHWPALAIARTVARHRSESGSDPAMQTIVVGAPLVLGTWALIAALAWRAAGPLGAVAALVALPLLADCDFALRDRAARARARVRAYLRFRREPSLQKTLVAAISAARNEATELERSLVENAGDAGNAGGEAA
jgi:glycerol-3-phosphate O-acyltransferase/dihydroxyacetone phosphate acyltransferase